MRIKKSTIERIIKEEIAKTRDSRLTKAKLKQHILEELNEYDAGQALKKDFSALFSKNKPSVRSYATKGVKKTGKLTASAWRMIVGDGGSADTDGDGQVSTQEVIDRIIVEVAALKEKVERLEAEMEDRSTPAEDEEPIDVEDEDIISSDPLPPPLPQT